MYARREMASAPTRTLAELPDADLVECARTGDRRAFGELLGRHERRVYRLAARMCRNERDAEEIVQEAMLRAFRQLDSFRGESSFATWLHRIVVNLALMRRRSDQRHPTEPLDAALPEFDSNGMLVRMDADYGRAARADELLDRKDLNAAMQAAMAMLPATLHEVFVLRDLEELSTDETSEALGLSNDVVRQRLHRARLALRAALSQRLGGS